MHNNGIFLEQGFRLILCGKHEINLKKVGKFLAKVRSIEKRQRARRLIVKTTEIQSETLLKTMKFRFCVVISRFIGKKALKRG